MKNAVVAAIICFGLAACAQAPTSGNAAVDAKCAFAAAQAVPSAGFPLIENNRRAELQGLCERAGGPDGLLTPGVAVPTSSPAAVFANIVVLRAGTPEQAVAEICPPLAVFNAGRRTVIR